jgi:5'-3' exonuclease
MGLSLIIDGNYLFYKTLYIFSGYSSGKRLLDSEKDRAMFMRKIATDMSHVIRTFGNPSKIIFTIDSKSWRKDIQIEDGAYKGTRVKDETAVDWDMFYSLLHEFGEILQKKGIIVSKEDRAEGDDLMHLWAATLFNNGEDAVIVTGDKDLTQCVKFNGENFVVVYNPNSKTRKIVAPMGFAKWVNTNEYNLFDASTFMNRGKDLIAEALKSIDIQEIDPAYLIFEKVIIGDAGDAVPPIWTWENKGKTFKISPSKASRIYEILNLKNRLTDVYDLPSRAADVVDCMLTVCNKKAPYEIIKERLDRNLLLVYLDERIIPADIQDKFKASFQRDANTNLSANTYDMAFFIGETRFFESSKSFESDIFKSFSF